jgi:hypothetical protein
MTETSLYYFNNKYNKIINDTILAMSYNYILHGSITDLYSTSKNNIYLLKVNQENNTRYELAILTEIASGIIKFLKETITDFTKKSVYYVKLNDYICKFIILENNETEMKYKLILKYILE